MRLLGVFRALLRTLPLVVLLLFFFLLILANPVRNTDTWKHLVDGQYLYYFAKFPHYSTFTVAPVREIIPGDSIDWLGSLGLYTVASAGGYAELHALKFLLPVPLILLVTWILRYRLNVVWLAANVLVLYGVSAKLYARAAGSSVFFLGVLLFLLLRFRRTGETSSLWFLLPLLTLWSNVHGSYLVGAFFMFLFFTGTVLDYYGGDSDVSGASLRRFVLVLILVVLAVTFVKPFPDYSLFSRAEGALNRITVMEETGGSGETSVTNDPVKEETKPLLSTVKAMTHDVIVPDRPYVAPEFSFPLHKTEAPLVVLSFFVLLPLVVLVLLLRWGSVPWSTLLPLAFVFWLGAGVERATPFIPAVTIPFLLVEWRRGMTPESSGKSNSGNLDRHFVTRSVLWTGCGLFLVLWVGGAFGPKSFPDSVVGATGLDKNPGFSFGRAYYYQSELPRFVRDRFPDRPVYTSGDIGSYVLWIWWPHKKVYLQSKTSAYREEFLRKLESPESMYRLIEEDGVDLALISRAEHNLGRNIFEAQSGWNLMAWSVPYRLTYLYCKCEPKSDTLR